VTASGTLRAWLAAQPLHRQLWFAVAGLGPLILLF
jgi:hypothetical protein